jgi:hypothetical protein
LDRRSLQPNIHPTKVRRQTDPMCETVRSNRQIRTIRTDPHKSPGGNPGES